MGLHIVAGMCVGIFINLIGDICLTINRNGLKLNGGLFNPVQYLLWSIYGAIVGLISHLLLVWL